MKPFSMKYIILLLITITLGIQCSTNSTSIESAKEYRVMSVEKNQAWVDTNLDKVMQKKTFAAGNGMNLPYRLFIPESYSSTSEIPLLIHLHGRGDRGTDNRPEIYNKLPLFNGPNSVVSPNSQNRYPSIVLVPQCSDKTINEEWAKWVGNTPETPFKGLGKDGSYKMNPEPSESGAATIELIEAIIEEYNIDKNRVYITGTSMGGFGTWEMVGRRPDLFAAAAPMAGYSDPSIIDKIKFIPFWIFHGGEDTVNPPKGSQTMNDLLNKAVANVKYTEYPDAAHSPAFQLAWKESELLPWLFSHSKARVRHFPKKRKKVTDIPNKENVWVFLMAGQSNMAGRGQVSPQDTVINSRILSIDKLGQLIYAQEPLHAYEPIRTGLDCGLSFGTTLLENIPDNVTVLLLPTAIGGSAIQQWLGDSTYREVQLLSNFKEKVDIGKQYGTVKGILWHQGESDAHDHLIPLYQDKLTELVGIFRNYVGDETLPVMMAELGYYSTTNDQWQQINTAIQNCASADENIRLVSVSDLIDKGDNVHFDSNGQRTIGKRLAMEYLDISQ